MSPIKQRIIACKPSELEGLKEELAGYKYISGATKRRCERLIAAKEKRK